MNLHVDRYAYAGEGESGAPLLLIHGWGMHGGMWRGVAEQMAQHCSVMAVDLPGHGYSAWGGKCKNDSGKWGVESGKTAPHSPLATCHSTLDSIVDQLSSQFDGTLSLCGWSLGGQVALRWAMRHPQQVRRLILVASTPCFVRQPDWCCAMAGATLQEFAAALQQNYALTLRRFLALQVRGSEQERELLVTLRDALFSRGEPDFSALQSGLDILRDCDLREQLAGMETDTLVLAGERDTLTPVQASSYMASQLPHAQLATIRGAAHAPFMSHPEEFLQCLKSFLHE
ncbi:MAG: alpha/beta fold hydrolase [Nitrosomonadales bacterium]|nr:alpha/beta fold hydrolase [Nitrosomonadales bacterium]